MAATEFMEREGRPRVVGDQEGAPTTWAKGPTRYTAKFAQNRWRSTLSWSHSMIHATSGARTRTKSTVSSSSFQRVLIRLVSTSYDGVIAETVRKCRLNPRWTWQLSRRRSPTWERSWRMCVQHGDVLIIPPLLESESSSTPSHHQSPGKG